MSYDLLLVGRADSAVARSLDYFRSRPHYTVTDAQAVYENPDTNVYFSFDATGSEADDPEADQPRGTWLALNLNLYRPSVFGLEAAREVLAVTVATDSDVFDPQADDPAVRSFDTEEFLGRWNHANRRGHVALLSEREGQDPVPWPRSLPASTLRAVWEWNCARQAWNDALGDQVFVPCICFLDGGTDVETAVVWTDAIPVVLPRVDRVLLYRDELRPKRWFGRSKAPDLSEVTWAELAPFLPSPVESGRPLPYYDLRAPSNAVALQRLIAGQPPLERPPKGLALDQVHDAELLPTGSER